MVPVAEFVGRNLARNLDGVLGTRGLEDLHKQIDEDAESGASQVAHALGKRHGKEQLQLRWPRGWDRVPPQKSRRSAQPRVSQPAVTRCVITLAYIGHDVSVKWSRINRRKSTQRYHYYRDLVSTGVIAQRQIKDALLWPKTRKSPDLRTS